MRAFAPEKSAEKSAVHLSARGRHEDNGVQSPSLSTSLSLPVLPKSSCACGGGCPGCRTLGESPVIQTKLQISQPGDVFEQEADLVSDQVMRMEAVNIKGDVPTPKRVQPRDLGGNSVGDAPPIVHEVLRAPGQPMDNETREFMEARFGHQFGSVRVHTDAKAGESARAVSARAYTAGQHIVLGAGEYAPASDSGRKLLAHELTHVIQQSERSSPAVQRYISADVLTTQITTAQAEEMTDSELYQEIQRLRRHLGTLAPASAEYIGAVENLSTLERVAIQRQSESSEEALPHEEELPVPPTEGGIDTAVLDQCIAELGGSPGYRDGGLASAEELERYRQECLARQAGSRGISRAVENLARAWEYAQADIGPEVRREVAALFSPESLAAMAAFAVLYVASQLTPVGWVADALALTVLTLTVIFVGALVIDIARDLFRFFSAVDATTDDDLRASGHALARALARGGVGIFIALLSRGLRGGTRPPTPTAGAPVTALVEVVTVSGGRARIPVMVTTAAEAVEASRLQALASYAVMVPPPGGTSPSAPSSSSSSGRGSGSGTRESGSSEGGRRGTGIGSPGGLVRIPYGEGALSLFAQRLRLALGLRRGGNVAVFEFENIPDSFRTLATRLGGRNVRIEGNRMAVQNVDGSAHSEQLAHMLISEGRRSGIELNVIEIYTEYNPCTTTCLPLIQRQYQNARVTYSFIWELWGRETPDRNAAVEALFAAEE